MSVAAPTSAGDRHGAPPGRRAACSDATSSTRRLAGVEPIGREDELADIVARVGAGRRLVTIVGPGGIGKTTLARAACAALDGGTPEGRLVELSRVERSDAVTGAIAADLGFAAFEVVLGSPELNGGVVVVDNCEHVADAAAGAVGAMLRACPSLVILATSRSPLAVDDESIVALAPLALPSPGLVDADVRVGAAVPRAGPRRRRHHRRPPPRRGRRDLPSTRRHAAAHRARRAHVCDR